MKVDVEPALKQRFHADKNSRGQQNHNALQGQRFSEKTLKAGRVFLHNQLGHKTEECGNKAETAENRGAFRNVYANGIYAVLHVAQQAHKQNGNGEVDKKENAFAENHPRNTGNRLTREKGILFLFHHTLFDYIHAASFPGIMIRRRHNKASSKSALHTDVRSQRVTVILQLMRLNNPCAADGSR